MATQTSSPARLDALQHWLASLPSELALQTSSIRPASSDASFRRYFRIKANDRSLIVMDAPPPHEDITPFIDVTQRLSQAGVTTPEVVEFDQAQGFMLLTDLGNQTYYDVIQAGASQSQLQSHYRDALDMLVILQQAKQTGLATFDADRLTTELHLFIEWYVEKHHATSLTDTEKNQLERVFALLATAMAAEPRVLVHRDFHSPNLMVYEQDPSRPNPGVIDYQDALSGPISYDIASLVFDARTTWQEPEQLDWAIRYWEKARAAGLPVPDDFAQFHQQYEWAGLQRNLRILGVFARLNHRDSKSHYLAHIPRVLGYVRQVASRYQPFVPLMRILDRLEGIAPEVKLTF